jgi:hypothetical protein
MAHQKKFGGSVTANVLKDVFMSGKHLFQTDAANQGYAHSVVINLHVLITQSLLLIQKLQRNVILRIQCATPLRVPLDQIKN